MSVLIKGMKMPRNSRNCPLAVMADDWEKECIVGGEYHWDNERVCEGCPLVEVPTPHGRLIDEKQIPYIDLNADMPQSRVRVWTTFMDRIDRMPTIIEAEEGEPNG